MKKIITFLLFLAGISVMAQNGCRTSEVTIDFYKNNPNAQKEFLDFNKYTEDFAKSQEKSALSGQNIIIPVVFHVYGTTQNGKTVNDQKIINSLQMVNEDFQGLNPDFYTVDPLFEGVRSKTNIEFKLAQIDPNGSPTTGIIYHAASSGQANFNSPIVAADGWDNYKYMNIYITADLYDNGESNNSGVAWLPDTSMSDADIARVVYNGQYLKGNTDDEFASILTHEFGHWLNLSHTFEGGCTSLTQDYVDDTPQEDANSTDDGCAVGASDCGGTSLINYENYMGYDSSTGCAKMFTKGQTDRMYAALHHAARVTLWQDANLIATGVGSSYDITPSVFDGATTTQSAFLQVCAGTNINMGTTQTGIQQNVTLLKPNGLVDTTTDGDTFWTFDNVQPEDAGIYIICYNDGSGNIGFAPIELQVGYEITPWVNDSADWSIGNELSVCPGTNIYLGMEYRGLNNASIELPNGSIDTTPDVGTAWQFTNVQPADAGTYTVTYDFGGCTASVQIELKIQEEIIPWVNDGSDWLQQSYVEACPGDTGVYIGMQSGAGTSNVTLTAPNGSVDTTPDVATGFLLSALQASDFGVYTITWNNPSGCTGSTQIELKYKDDTLLGWVRDNNNNWFRKSSLFACTGDNIAIGTTNLGTTDFKITYPNGTVDTTPDIATGWYLNNIQESDEGRYKIEFGDPSRCYAVTYVDLVVDNTVLGSEVEYEINGQGFTPSATNSITVDGGDKVSVRIPSNLFEGSISWTGPNGFTSNASTIEVTNLAVDGVHDGTYTATINHTVDCSSVKAPEVVNFEIAFNVLSIGEEEITIFDMYPNPTNDGLVTIRKKDSNRDLRLMVSDLQGKTLINTSNNEFSSNEMILDLRQYSAGVYFISAYSGDKSSTKRIVKYK
ncbi:zinc-dependent metalloprotease [Aquimarina sp. 2201CG5-10]|uniref:zinc-dependent metalloprotease n=1 Tax=Aquimarina callyspongiae TaxID=3098150 RepID=UPI002AB34913|nr:zinc-dependent metalloprotease [Aquimarina sp. 2201CG5-10]MDY8134822.1 zinc-dependent metalloprotease [Aquimarina sp. 2201CG5-10]